MNRNVLNDLIRNSKSDSELLEAIQDAFVPEPHATTASWLTSTAGRLLTHPSFCAGYHSGKDMRTL